MERPSRLGTLLRSRRLRRWVLLIGIACVALEVAYIVAANAFLRSDRFTQLVNAKPEKAFISWDSAVTYFPGWARVQGFTLRSQTKKDQVYVHVDEATARISLIKLIFKTIHIRGVDAREVDFRYRERFDSPKRIEAEGVATEPPRDLEYYPEIPGLTNPPDPKPEELYPRKRKRHPWTISITGADVEGPISVALNAVRIEGDGSVGGGVTVKPRKTITIHRGKLGLNRARVQIGPELVSENLAIHSDLRIDTFPARGASFADIVSGLSGDLSLAGELSEKVALSREVTPGITTIVGGVIAANLYFKKGVLQAKSQFSMQSSAFHLRIMGLDAVGSAKASGSTVRERGRHLTSSTIRFGDFQFLDPEDESVAIAGSGLALNAEWDGLSLAGGVPARWVEVIVPPTEVRDVSVFNELLPAEGSLSIESGTGEVEARLEVDESRVAAGRMHLVADDIVLRSGDIPFFGDLEVHANLAKGDLPTRSFDLSGTTIRVDDVVDPELSEKKQRKLEPWYCDVELEQGEFTFCKPVAAHGRARVKMYDIRPLVALLQDLSGKMKWLSLMPKVKDIDGTMNVDFDDGFLAVEDLVLTGKDLEVLGWTHIRNKKADGRIYAKYGIFAAGVALDQGKKKVTLSKPRKWFEEQTGPPAKTAQPVAGDGS